jgi:uncharacterized protein (TIGR02145 family)
MKKQRKDAQLCISNRGAFPLRKLKTLLLAMLGGLATTAFAQGVEICSNTAYPIASTVDASGASTYQWLENGQLIPNASAATYEVPNTKTAGLYTYIRQAKSADCSEWQSSNEFTVTVFDCSFTATTVTTGTIFVDPRDGKRYKTVEMPDGKTWFAQNLNYTKDLTYNAYAYEANGKQFTSTANGVPAIGSYWCPPLYWVSGASTTPVASGDEAACNTYGALYTWETAMMVDGKYSDEAKTSSVWDEAWLTGKYLSSGVAPNATSAASYSNARGGRGICPLGWHVPTEKDWVELLDAVDDAAETYTLQTGTGWWGTNAGEKLKSASTFTATKTDPGDRSWLDGEYRGSNNSGFAAVPAGLVSLNGDFFRYRGLQALYWTSSANNVQHAWRRAFNSQAIAVHRDMAVRGYGFSVRCVR